MNVNCMEVLTSCDRLGINWPLLLLIFWVKPIKLIEMKLWLVDVYWTNKDKTKGKSAAAVMVICSEIINLFSCGSCLFSTVVCWDLICDTLWKSRNYYVWIGCICIYNRWKDESLFTINNVQLFHFLTLEQQKTYMVLHFWLKRNANIKRCFRTTTTSHISSQNQDYLLVYASDFPDNVMKKICLLKELHHNSK